MTLGSDGRVRIRVDVTQDELDVRVQVKDIEQHAEVVKVMRGVGARVALI